VVDHLRRRPRDGGIFRRALDRLSWIGLRAQKARAQASALYLFFYYFGSSLAGWTGGWVLAWAGWPGVAAFVGALAGLALLVALRPSRVPPPAHMRS